MSWSYTFGATPSLKDQVRRLIGDVISSDQQIQDEEITWALTQRTNIYGASALCCDFIASQYSRKVDVVTQSPGGGALKTNYSAQAKAYRMKKVDFENLAAGRSGGLPYAGGISIADKQANEEDSDRVAPQFNIGMDDNFVPEGPIGNETLDAPSEPFSED